MEESVSTEGLMRSDQPNGKPFPVFLLNNKHGTSVSGCSQASPVHACYSDAL
jgi:hypothetical protein